MTEKRPPWWPTADDKAHADAGCAHPDTCRLPEPPRMGARVRDRDGQTWRRGRRVWTCEAKVGTTYLDRKTGRMATVERVGRLPWSALRSMYGPVEIVDTGEKGPR